MGQERWKAGGAMNYQTEHQLCNAIVEALNYSGHYVWRTNSGVLPMEYKGKTRMVRMSRAGTSDILGVAKGGRFLAIEVKLPKRKKNVTEAQQLFLEDIQRRGGVAGVATTIEEALTIIKQHGIYETVSPY
jgi:hypothetical protein